MELARRSQRGFARPELMIYVALIGVAAALVGPTVTRLLRHEPITPWGWALLGIGVVLGVLGIWPLVGQFFGGWLESRRKN